jgi:hypothetical protein
VLFVAFICLTKIATSAAPDGETTSRLEQLDVIVSSIEAFSLGVVFIGMVVNPILFLLALADSEGKLRPGGAEDNKETHVNN